LSKSPSSDPSASPRTFPLLPERLTAARTACRRRRKRSRSSVRDPIPCTSSGNIQPPPPKASSSSRCPSRIARRLVTGGTRAPPLCFDQRQRRLRSRLTCAVAVSIGQPLRHVRAAPAAGNRGTCPSSGSAHLQPQLSTVVAEITAHRKRGRSGNPRASCMLLDLIAEHSAIDSGVEFQMQRVTKEIPPTARTRHRHRRAKRPPPLGERQSTAAAAFQFLTALGLLLQFTGKVSSRASTASGAPSNGASRSTVRSGKRPGSPPETRAADRAPPCPAPGRTRQRRVIFAAAAASTAYPVRDHISWAVETLSPKNSVRVCR